MEIKKMSIGLAFMFVLFSCEQVDMEVSGNEVIEFEQSNVELVSVKDVTNEYNSSLRSTWQSSDWDYPTNYDKFVPIHRYLWYTGFTNIDHFYDVQQSNTISHDGHTYQYELKDFNVLSSEGEKTLYRLYSPTLNDHILSTSSSVSGYQLETQLGKIFEKQQIGTVPLKEFYTSQRKKHMYEWVNVEFGGADSDFKYVKTIGYVYPGRIDSKKQATRIIIKPKDANDVEDFFKKISLIVRAYEGNNIYELEYSASTDNAGKAIFTMPNTYTVIAVNGICATKGYSVVVKNLTGNNAYGGSYSATGEVPGSSALFYGFVQSVNGYDVTLTYTKDIIMGIEN